MADKNQGSRTSEISVDLNAADESKAVTRRSASDIAEGVRDRDDGKPRTKVEKELFKRMNRMGRNLTKQFDQTLAAREAEWQRERSELQAKIDKVSVDRSGDDKADAAHEAAIAALKAKLEAAYEKGDSKESADITLQISRLDAQFWAKKANAAGVVTRESAADTTQARTTTTTAQPQRQKPTAAGARFITANEDWWEDPEFDVETQAANTIYLRLCQADGFDPKSDETFREVAKQLKKKFPDLDVRAGRKGPGDDDDDDDDDVDQNGDGNADGDGRRRAPVANIADRGGQGNAQRRDSNRRTLSEQERKTMVDCRLDPDNDRDVVQFLREAQALERAQA
jgi:hypothetical protein